MRRALCGVFAALSLMVVAAPASAQATDDEAAVRAVVIRLFDGMRARDTAMMRSVFAEQAMFYGHDREGRIVTSTPSDFITSIAGAPAGLKLDEVLHDIEIRVDGPLAAVWTYYDLFVGDNFQHCGYDAVHLLKVSNEWKIVALADSRRRQNCRQQRG